jgi:hypothetical protein
VPEYENCREACAFFGGVDPLSMTNESPGVNRTFCIVKNGGLGLLRHSASVYEVSIPGGRLFSTTGLLGRPRRRPPGFSVFARLNIHAFSTQPCLIWISADCSCLYFKILRNLQL